MILFVSDTGKSILSKLPFSNHKIVIIECTFIEDKHYEDSVRKKHLHWKDLEPIISSNKETIFILGHFSVRYNNSYLIEKEKELQSKYTNMKFWI
jgi:ribonuclease Z